MLILDPQRVGWLGIIVAIRGQFGPRSPTYQFRRVSFSKCVMAAMGAVAVDAGSEISNDTTTTISSDLANKFKSAASRI